MDLLSIRTPDIACMGLLCRIILLLYQYFVVCVPATTSTDRLARSLLPTGPVVPRLVRCPGQQRFDPDTKLCQEP